MPVAPPVESLIVLSDVHLGSDLVAHQGVARRRSPQIDRELAALVDHHRAHPPRRGRWRLVIAGDLIDFIGMALPPEDGLVTAPSEEERAHGLGSAADHAVAKARAVVARHRDVFDALARFIADGNAISIIHGNHDLELHWEEVRAELTEALIQTARAHLEARGALFDRGRLLARIEYSPWFFYREGVAYIEHGHQYDPFCATEHLLAPLSPVDPRRVARGFSDVLLRFVVRRTPGLSEHGHETMGIVDYLRFGRRLGARGMAALTVRFARAVRELFRLRSEHLRGASRELRAQHQRAMARFAAARKVGLGRVRALWKLQATPITRSVAGILASLLLDRLALGVACVSALLALAIAGLYEPRLLLGALVVTPAWLLGQRCLARRRRIDADAELAASAADVAALFPAPFIVMGHTHVPMKRELRPGVTYVNVGSWAEEDEGGARASRAYLIIHPDDQGARFLRWDGGSPALGSTALGSTAPARG